MKKMSFIKEMLYCCRHFIGFEKFYKSMFDGLFLLQSDPLKVCVTGAAGQIAYSLLYSLAKGDVFGADQVIDVHVHTCISQLCVILCFVLFYETQYK